MFRRNDFIIFIPSWRRIEFLQKNIRQLNVEFIERNVFDHKLNNKTRLSYNCISDDAKRKTEYIIFGQEQTKKQPTAQEHVEIFLRFKISFFLFSSDAISSTRFDFAITNIL